MNKITKYQEIIKLHNMLVEENIPHTFDEINGGYGVWVPNQTMCKFDAVQHSFSYGSDEGYLETMGTPTDEDDVTGYRKAEDVFEEFKTEYYKSIK